MKFARRTITFPEKEYREEKAKMEALLQQYEDKLKRYERFEDDVRDAMDYMYEDDHYHRLNTALARLMP
jgi:hypothetical protein